MSENYSLKELNEWADKVIDCISKWADEMNKAFNGTPTSIKIEKLDFSEHDKVFEDKIAELKKDYKTASELLKQYQRENEVLKRRIQELDTIDTIRIDENRKLKQRIAELESKETEKPTKYTTVIVAKEINGQTYVTLDDFTFVVNALQAQIGT